MKAGILTIGDELLDGFKVDTNSAWLAQRLLKRGVTVVAKASVGDEVEPIEQLLGGWDGQLDLVIATGGLGPTQDDVTKAAFCRHFRCDLRFDQDYWEALVRRFADRGLDIPANNRSQAEIPTRAESIPNSIGSAPGLKFQSDTTTFFVLPGVPAEMKAIMTDHVLPVLGGGEGIAWVTLYISGSFESALATRLDPIIAGRPEIKVAFLPSYTGFELRVRGLVAGEAGREAVLQAVAALEAELGELVIGRDGEPLEAAVGKLLRERGETLGLAESCSGGLATSRLTDVPGASDYLLGAVVAYSDAAKESLLDVSRNTLARHGAVSEATAREMAQGARARFGADWGVATTGIAGPGGGSPDKPVGLVYLSVAREGRTVALEAHLIPERLPHKEATSQAALNLLRRELLRHG